MINYDNIAFDYEPFPIGITKAAFDEKIYRDLVDNLPPVDLFEYKPDKGGKFSLSQVNHSRQYRQFIRTSEPWRAFHAFIKSPEFINGVLEMLRDNNIDIGLPYPGVFKRLYLKGRAIKRGNPVPHFKHLKARFEFSAMPVTGGNILPHTDHLKKLVILVIPMLKEDEWNDDWGGGTSIVWPKDKTKIYNPTNAYLGFDETEVVKTFPFEPNQCVVFVKTNNSWHAVLPMTGTDPKILRNTLTINIESS